MTVSVDLFTDIFIAVCPLFLYFGPLQLFYDLKRRRRKAALEQRRAGDENVTEVAQVIGTGRMREGAADFFLDGAVLHLRMQVGRHAHAERRGDGDDHPPGDSSEHLHVQDEGEVEENEGAGVAALEVVREQLPPPPNPPAPDTACALSMKAGGGALGEVEAEEDELGNNDVTGTTVDTLIRSRPSVLAVFSELSPRGGGVRVSLSGDHEEGADVHVYPAEPCDSDNFSAASSASSVSPAAVGGTAAEGPEADSTANMPARFANANLESNGFEGEDRTGFSTPDVLLEHQLNTPPLPFVAQIANGFTWLYLFCLEKMPTGIVPCCIQILTGVLWLFLYAKHYRPDLYEKQLTLQTCLLLLYVGSISTLFCLADSAHEQEEHAGAVENNSRVPATSAHTAQVVFTALGTGTLLMLLGAPVMYAKRAWGERDASLMGSWCSNAAGFGVGATWAVHTATEGLVFVAAINVVAASFSLFCLGLRTFLDAGGRQLRLGK
eukprot:CAMPEP_0178995450 /NCGR_PEP_ID=MMETSP0795-20121207/7834_1 /TAXON_ID=88552 /ORGANISM="Amoebophrya sp., Strain Ameob2" /LENGTH=493 /DNA_ID=CAMNT_0020687759 /DNA_START=12 /DNA_END=1493 /DNA_ORIENTATION=-